MLAVASDGVLGAIEARVALLGIDFFGVAVALQVDKLLKSLLFGVEALERLDLHGDISPDGDRRTFLKLTYRPPPAAFEVNPRFAALQLDDVQQCRRRCSRDAAVS